MTSQFHLLPRLRMSTAVPLLPLYACMACTGKNLSFTKYSYSPNNTQSRSPGQQCTQNLYKAEAECQKQENLCKEYSDENILYHIIIHPQWQIHCRQTLGETRLGKM